MSIFLKKTNLDSYTSGRQISSFKDNFDKTKIIKLSSNENILGPSPKVYSALKDDLSDLHVYPDSQYYPLRSLLAERNNVSSENLFLTNGAAEAIDLIALAYLGSEDEVIISDPTFPKYKISSQRFGAKIISINLSNNCHDILSIKNNITKQTKIIFLDNPNNPVGTIINKSDFYDLITSLPQHVILVLDEAYKEYVKNSYEIEYSDLIKNRNVFILRSFSKAYGLAGLRLGYVITNRELIYDLNKVCEAFNVNRLAIKAGLASLIDNEHLNKNLELTNRNKNYLYSQLDILNFEYCKSEANFILINTKRPIDEVNNFLTEHGILVRKINMRNRKEGFIRVTVGTEEQNQIFINTLSLIKEKIKEINI